MVASGPSGFCSDLQTGQAMDGGVSRSIMEPRFARFVSRRVLTWRGAAVSALAHVLYSGSGRSLDLVFSELPQLVLERLDLAFTFRQQIFVIDLCAHSCSCIPSVSCFVSMLSSLSQPQ